MHNPLDPLSPEALAAARARLHALHAAAEITADALLDDAWRRLIGPAHRLVRALLIARLEAGEVAGEHVFARLSDAATLAGVSERTVQRWLSPGYAGARWLRCWISWRVQYMRRDDGLPCRAGTVFRVFTTPRPTHDIVPVARPTLAALKAEWRRADELPAALNPTLSNTRHESAGSITFRQARKAQKFPVRVEGRDVDVPDNTSPTLSSNTRHALSSRVTASSARAASAWARAEVVARKLGDQHSRAFWAGAFLAAERAGVGEGAVWAAVGQAAEMLEAGLVRHSAGGYAVGILKRAGLGSRPALAPATGALSRERQRRSLS